MVGIGAGVIARRLSLARTKISTGEAVPRSEEAQQKIAVEKTFHRLKLAKLAPGGQIPKAPLIGGCYFSRTRLHRRLMTYLTVAAALVLAFETSAFAITQEDIAPANLVGKTLIFDIENGGSPYATNGKWSGKFAGTGNAFAVRRITGDTVNIDSTFTASPDGTFTTAVIQKFIEGEAPANLTLFVSGTTGRYEVSIADVFGVSLNGTFTISAPATKGPEISIQQPVGSQLVAGRSGRSFGSVVVTKSESKTFQIKNVGSRPLRNLAVSVKTGNANDFIPGALTETVLAPGVSATFKITFRPKGFGNRQSVVSVASNDTDENPFQFRVSGAGVDSK